MNESLVQQLADCGQDHLLEDTEALDPVTLERFERQLEAIDWEALRSLLDTWDGSWARVVEPDAVPELPHLVRQPEADSEQARACGEQRIADGRVAVVTVAGGRGSRLGSDRPKGLLPVMPVSGRTFLEHFAACIGERSQRAGRAIPWLVMTSPETDGLTRTYFDQQQHFGLDPGQVVLFQQGTRPVVEIGTGRVLLSEPGRVATSPDGHGGLLEAMRRAELFGWLGDRGVDSLFYHQVDNPAVLPPDPLLVGWHHLRGSQMTTRVVSRRTAEERMGVVLSVAGRTRIVEYIDLPQSVAAAGDGGRLRFWAGNIGVHVLDQQVLAHASGLPWHRVDRTVVHVPGHGSGQPIEPGTANAWQFERFIFDLLPEIETGLVVEGDRGRDFLPVKQSRGTDSLESARAGLLALHRSWLEAAGTSVHPEAEVEITPSWALSAEEVLDRSGSDVAVQARTVFE